MQRREFLSMAAAFGTAPSSHVELLRLPEGAMQPKAAMGRDGGLHLIYLKGEPGAADVYFTRSGDGGRSFAPAARVNSQAGSAIATGTIRGAQIALGAGGMVHVAWNGSMQALPPGPLNPEAGKPGQPFLYSSLERDGKFAPQRNLMTRTFGLDGGGSLAADRSGGVYAAWHGKAEGAAKGEAGRAVWMAKSADSGATFAAEATCWKEATGACGCCGMGLYADSKGTLYGLYRSAAGEVHRDIYLLVSNDAGRSFRGSLVHRWQINACPMSSMAFAEGPNGVYGAWETEGQVYFTRLDGKQDPIVAAPEPAGKRRHPSLAIDADGRLLLTWTEGTGWKRGGSLGWQVFDAAGRAVGAVGSAANVPVWSFGAAIARPKGGFAILY